MIRLVLADTKTLAAVNAFFDELSNHGDEPRMYASSFGSHHVQPSLPICVVIRSDASTTSIPKRR